MRNDRELTTDEWSCVINEAAGLGVLQIGFSGGEPLVRRDLAELVRTARAARLYTNLITSGVGLDEKRTRELRDAGLDSVFNPTMLTLPMRSRAHTRISESSMPQRSFAQLEFRLASIS
jgi:molybdenum cofactor biosynthesis enzyme MoaA